MKLNKMLKTGISLSIILFACSFYSLAKEKDVQNDNFITGEKVKLGTLYVGGSKQLNPLNPVGGGDIPSYKSLGVGSTIEIKNTDTDPRYQIQWVKAEVDGKKILISDRNLLAYISWENLNNQSLIEGKEVIIDGEKYILRVLSGGTESKDGYDGSFGGNIPNEWDKVIVNENSYSGLPTPSETDLDKTTDETDLVSPHNKFWNWYKCNSWTQSLHETDKSSAVYRGYYSARTISHNTYTEAYSNYGWRPVLEKIPTPEELATDAVIKAEKTKTDEDIDYAINLINKVNNTEVKGKLNSRIGVVYIEISEEVRTVESISKARKFLNTLDESGDKNGLNERLNNVTPDMSMTPLSSTANLDVYIKSENLLSMAVNTNSITFEEFSGVEDLENLGAVNITINSSLPYELNAYLPSEIQNGDKSKTMDKQILNIKESSELDYKSFSSINQKLILKDNNSSGNNLIHSIDLKLKGGLSFERDVYKTTLKFEAQQK